MEHLSDRQFVGKQAARTASKLHEIIQSVKQNKIGRKKPLGIVVIGEPNRSICEVIKQNESEVGSDMLLVSDYFILRKCANTI